MDNVGCEDVCQEQANEQVYTAKVITATDSKSNVKCVRRGERCLTHRVKLTKIKVMEKTLGKTWNITKILTPFKRLWGW